jgi:mannose-6-phosphate isomerase-like protein (cupin superfamily)
MIEIFNNKQLLAIIISQGFHKQGVEFFTDEEMGQQVAFMKHSKGKLIQPHIHNPVKREVFYTQETLIIKKGKLRVDIYTDEQIFIESQILYAGDVILLIQGGHGFEVLEDLEMIEVKQGPYAGEKDKTRFKPQDGNKL